MPLRTIEYGVVGDTKLGMSIDDPWIARRLIKLGYTIQDVKPQPRNKARTRFIFIRTGNLAEDVEALRRIRYKERG